MEATETTRAQWRSRWGFIMAALGSAIGLGNIWRFAYMAYKNGGGAFLVPYFVALFVVGIPIMILEFMLGQRLRASAPLAFEKVNRRFAWVGWWAVIFVMFGIVVYYCVIVAWCLNFTFFSVDLAWTKPDPAKLEWRGLTVAAADDDRCATLGYPAGRQGLFVTDGTLEPAAGTAPAAGDLLTAVNGRPVTGLEDFGQVIAGLETADVALEFQRRTVSEESGRNVIEYNHLRATVGPAPPAPALTPKQKQEQAAQELSGACNDFFNNRYLGLPAATQATAEADGDPNPVFRLGGIRWPILAALAVIWLANWLIVFLGVDRGIEKACKIFMPLLFGLILVLIIWVLTLDGAGAGIKKYLTPEWDRLRDAGVWVDAFSQIFFSLSLGFGIMIAYASYLPKDADITSNAILTSVGNCLFSFIAGFAVFGTLGFMAHASGQHIQDVATKEIGLAFVAYPAAIGMLPVAPFLKSLFGVLFFGSLVIAGLSSSISILEAFAAAMMDRFGVSRRKLVTLLCLAGFLLGLIFVTGAGLYWLDIIDQFANKFGLLTVAILECLIVGWVYTAQRMRSHVDEVSRLKIHGWSDNLMRLLITACLAATWLGLAKLSGTGELATQLGAVIGRIAILAALVVLWLSDHWLDFNIKLAIPALLLVLMDQALVGTLIAGGEAVFLARDAAGNLVERSVATYYGGYTGSAVFGIGGVWLLATLAAAFVVSAVAQYRGRLESEGQGSDEMIGPLVD